MGAVKEITLSDNTYKQLYENTKAENEILFNLVRKLHLPFDQLINEYNYSWVHVSYSPRNRKQILHLS